MVRYSVNSEVFAFTFIPSFKKQHRFNQLKGDKLIREVLFSWYEKIQHNGSGQEPRRALAETLSKLGDELLASCEESQNVVVMLERLAKVNSKSYTFL